MVNLPHYLVFSVSMVVADFLARVWTPEFEHQGSDNLITSIYHLDICACITIISHEHDGLLNHCQLGCLFNGVFAHTNNKENIRAPQLLALFEGNPITNHQ